MRLAEIACLRRLIEKDRRLVETNKKAADLTHSLLG